MQLKLMKVLDNCKLTIHFNHKDPCMEKMIIKLKLFIKKNYRKMKMKANIQIKMKKMHKKEIINKDSLHN